jgi:drug/metabolite transporter (DMT)-like permease
MNGTCAFNHRIRFPGTQSRMHQHTYPTLARTLALTLIAMLAFAANSLLCRMALRNTGIDPASFTAVRLLSGALVLWLIVRRRNGDQAMTGSWLSALALFTYAAGFSYAYVNLSAATGALLLFGAVQATMISTGLWRGERLTRQQLAGLLCAFAGLAGLLAPGISAPPWSGALLMVAAGVAWGIYSLRAKGAGNPTGATAGNFARALPLALILSAATLSYSRLDGAGILYAIVSGAVASGLGYAVWYTALRGLSASSAASVQLSVPVIAAVGGVLLLGEPIALRLLITSVAILGGVALVIYRRTV